MWRNDPINIMSLHWFADHPAQYETEVKLNMTEQLTDT